MFLRVHENPANIFSKVLNKFKSIEEKTEELKYQSTVIDSNITEVNLILKIASMNLILI
jgi:hypothetical protein